MGLQEYLAGYLQVSAGFRTAQGQRTANEDYAAYEIGSNDQQNRFGLVFAVADGMGGAKGGRVAAELTTRSFIDGYYGSNELLGVQHNAANSLEAINRWIHALGRQDPALENMGSTFTALILHGRRAHMVHVGDSRLYRLRDKVLTQLSTDHTPGLAGMKHMLTRAIGLEDHLRIDYTVEPVRIRDRYLLVSDGVHGGLSNNLIQDELARHNAPEDAAQRLVEAALAARIGDNATALVVDILALPEPNQLDLEAAVAAQPIIATPSADTVIDGFELRRIVSDGRYSRVFRGYDAMAKREVIVKFPKPVVGADKVLRQAFLREAWIAARISSPWVGEAIEIPLERRSCLYTVMPYYNGETLERRLQKLPRLSLSRGIGIAIKLSNAVVTLHRAGIIHRDIKPENVILEEDGGVKLIDLGVARLPNMEDLPPADIPGTPSFMAPELFTGANGDEKTDLFALGVTIYRMFCEHYPYGEIEPFSHPRFGRPTPLLKHRPDLPAWLDQILIRSFAADPVERYQDVVEFIFALDHGAAMSVPATLRRQPLYSRNPLLFWKMISALLAAALLLSAKYR